MLVAPFIAYSFVVLKYSVNVPVRDDFDVALWFVERYIDSPTLRGKASLIFSQHAEHRIVLDRLFFAGQYYAFQEIDFRLATIFGNLGWISAAAALTWIAHSNYQLSLVKIVPIPFILLSFVHNRAMPGAMGSIQIYWFLLFAIAFIYFLSVGRTVLYCAFFLAAMFTSGGGLALYFIGNAYLARSKNWKSFAVFLGLSTLGMGIYFFRYHSYEKYPGLLAVARSPFNSIASFFAFLGDVFPDTWGTYALVAAAALGVVLTVLAITILRSSASDDFMKLMVSFVLLTALIVALRRGSLQVAEVLLPHYSMYSLILVAMIYIFASRSNWFSARRGVSLAALLCTLIYLIGISVAYALRFPDIRAERIAGIEAFHRGDPSQLPAFRKDRAAMRLETAERRHIYVFDEGR